MVTDLVELRRYHDWIASGGVPDRRVHVGRVPAWLGSSHTRLVESIPQPDGRPWRVFRSACALHVLVPADDGWYIGDLDLPAKSPAPAPRRIDHRLAERRRR